MIWSGRKRCSLRAGAVDVVIDEVRRIRLAARRHVLAGQNPDLLRRAQRAEVEQPVGAAVDFLIERCQLPQVEGVMTGLTCASRSSSGWSVTSSMRSAALVRAARCGAERRRCSRRGRQRFRQALRPRLVGPRGDVEPRREAGADGGVDAGAGPGGVLQLRQDLVGRRVAVAAVGVDERRAAPLRRRSARRGIALGRSQSARRDRASAR